MKDNTGVMIAVLTDGPVRMELASALVQMSHDERYQLQLIWSYARPIPANRQLIVKRFLLESDLDYLMMIDSDQWPYKNLLDLVEEDKDVVLFPVPVWRPGQEQPPIVSVLTPLEGTVVDLDEGPLVEIKRGGSVFLIARRVLETMAQPIFEYVFDDWGLMVVEEDINFCDKAREAGFSIWGAYSHPCGHVKTIDLVDVHNRVKEWSDAV